jgi:hypothetical protein
LIWKRRPHERLCILPHNRMRSKWQHGHHAATAGHENGEAYLLPRSCLRGSSGSASRWPLQEMSAISRKTLTALRSCCKRSSEKTRTLTAWCMASQAFRSAPLVELEVIFEVAGWRLRGRNPPRTNARRGRGRFSVEVKTSLKIRIHRRHYGNYNSRNSTNEVGADS